jgi:hypothetical protein
MNVARRRLDRTGAIRSRRKRARRRAGLVNVAIDVDETGAVEAMIRSGRLSDEQAMRRQLVERELALVVTEWIRRWTCK